MNKNTQNTMFLKAYITENIWSEVGGPGAILNLGSVWEGQPVNQEGQRESMGRKCPSYTKKCPSNWKMLERMERGFLLSYTFQEGSK